MFKLFLKYFAQFFCLFLVMLWCAIPFILLSIYCPHLFHRITLIITHHHLFFTLFRWSFIGVIAFLWPHFIQRRAVANAWPADKTTLWLAQRWRIVGWLVLLEILVCSNGVMAFIAGWK